MTLFKNILVKILTLESRMILKKYKPFIVAVTGSVGKTSAKDAIHCVLKGESRHVRKSEKSMNSEIGIPLTVIGVPNAWKSMSGWIRNIWAGYKLILFKGEYPDCLVLEIGADHPGDIKNVTKWLQPDIAVITKVSKTPVHVEFFDSPEQVFEEKAALGMAVKDGGSLILFADDEKVLSIGDRVRSRNVRIISYGTVPTADVIGREYSIVYKEENGVKFPTGTKFDVDIKGIVKSFDIYGVLGETCEYPVLAAVAVGLAKSVDPDMIVKNFEGYNAPRGRMNLVAGINRSTLIDDTYNSSPDAASSALRTLRSVETTGVKIAILGDMMELGKHAADEHKKIGREVAGVAGILITVGPRSRATAEEAIQAGIKPKMVYSFGSSNEVVDTGMPVVTGGDIVLIKGSQSVRMERVVKALMRSPNRSAELLVRQEKEWMEKK